MSPPTPTPIPAATAGPSSGSPPASPTFPPAAFTTTKTKREKMDSGDRERDAAAMDVDEDEGEDDVGQGEPERTSSRADADADAEEALPTDEARAQIRSGYRSLLNSVAVQEEQVVSGDADKETGRQLMKNMEKANKLYKDVKTPQEALLDARLLLQISRICRQRGEGLSANEQAFHPSEFAEKLIGFMRGSNRTADAWVKFGRGAQSLFARAPSVGYLYGSFADGEDATASQKFTRPRRVRVERRDDPTLGSTQYTDMSQLIVNDDDEEAAREAAATDRTEVLVKSTLKQLVTHYVRAGKTPIDYFSFVVNPDSFGATVENAFHTSFLVKEGKVSISVDEATGLPVIAPTTTKQQQQTEGPDGGEVPKRQVVMALSMQEWEAMRQALDLEEAMIDHGRRGRIADKRQRT